ncbi:MAG: T9SS type A sorting domain-containing protein [Bacteroidota bacterium]
MTATNILSTSADLGWIIGGAELQWNVELGLPGFIPGTGAELTGVTGTTDNPWNVTGGSPNTTYEFYVQADCGGSTSTWAGPYTFTTLCGAITSLPWTEDFELVTIPDFPNCWLKENGGWITTNNSNSTYDADAHSGTQFLRNNYSAIDEFIWSPGFDLISGTSYDFSFWWAGDNYNGWTGDVFYNIVQNSVGATQIGSSFVIPATTTTTTYQNVIKTFVPSASGVYYFAIRVNATSNPWYLSFDDFEMKLSPTCPQPTDLSAVNITDVSADLGWIEGGSATTWNVELGLPGFTPGTGAELTGVTGTTDNPWTASGGSPETDYEFYVQADCGGTDLSIWSGPYSFTTLMTPLTNPTPCAAGGLIIDELHIPINVTGITGTQLGTDILLNEVHFIAQHVYDSDMDISLESPNGVIVDLSIGNGSSDNDYGVPGGICDQYTNFNMFGIDGDISSGTAPFVGSFIPDGDFSDFNDGSDPNGIWTIHIIDTWPSSDNGVFEFTELTFRPISSETDIIAYSFPEATGPATINATNHTVNIEVGFGTSLTALVASYTLSIGATAEISATPQVSGVTSNDFSGSVTYTITAEDGTTTQDWVVTVTVASALLTETDILTYSFPEETGAAVIDPIGHTVNIEVDWEADITNLTADFTLSYGATASISAVPQTSGVTVNDFTNPVTYTITAEDGTTTQDWVVSVTIQPAPQGALCSNPIPLTLPVVSETGNTAGFGDNYDDGMACSSYYMTGDDIVYEFTVTQPGLLSGGMTSTETWIGMFILDGCPDAGANCIVTATSIGSSVSFSDEYLDAGTYYVVISSYPSPQSIDFDFNLYYNPLAPEVLWDATTFVESLANDGSIPTIVNLTLNDETFATTGVLTTTEYSVANVPAGLSVEINATTTTDAIVTLTGNAISHTNADDISNMEITFLDAAFTGGVASNVAGYSQTALVVDFIDPVEIVINEVDADQTVTDSEEFIELFDGGVGNSSLDGYALVFYNGANDLVYDAYDLDGYSTDANGYFVIGSSLVANVDYDLGPVTDLIQNGADAVALYIDDASSFIINTTAVTTNNLLDALVYDTNDPDDAGLLVLLNPGQPQINEGGQGISTLHSCSRLPNGSGGLRNTDTYSPAKPTPGEINRAIPVLTWDATTFLEDFANDGSIQTVVNISLSDETFVITSGVMTETTHYTVANVPAGLTVLITATDANNATIELIGNATSHLNADDIANMEITFTNAAFTANQAALVTNYSQTALAVDFFDVTPAFLTWDATTFTEDVANDGSISTVINLNLTFDTFVITTGAMTEATHYNVANVPAGLSVLITATDANNATVELTGNATNHADIDDISNMEITFLNAAFTGNDASNVTVASQTALVVDYIDPYIVDVAIIDPASGNYQMCGLPSTTPIQIEIQNLGDMAIVAGTTIDITAIIENNPMVTETMTLPDLNPNDTWTYTFTQLFDLSLIQVYNWKFYLHKYLSDIDATNDTTEGTMEHIELTVNIDNGDTVTVAALPYTLIESDVFDEYEWTNEIGTVLGTTSTVNVGAYGWYYLYVENYSTNCSAIDSILILEPVIVDLAVTMPGAINYLCDLTASEQVPVCITNYGSAAIIAGETIDVTLEFPIGTVYDVGTITLTSDLAVLDDICIYFGNTVDMSAIDIYDFGIYFTYLTDSDHNNDTVWGFVNHYETVVDLSGVNDTITVGAYPTTLDAGVCSNPGGFTCTYLWDDSSTNQTLDVSLDGWYYVTVTDDNGCEGDDSVYVVLNIGINDVENIFSVDVYPNPNNGFFTLAISSTNGTENTVQLIDLQGQVIETRKLSGNTIIETFDMTDIAKGIYYIKVSSDNGIKIEKVAVH